ncbi:MAG: hypothetical protein ACLFWB_14105 [Armatimonadota bacterium]
MINHDFEQQWTFGETNHGALEFQALDHNHEGVVDLLVGNRLGKIYSFDSRTDDSMG